MLYHSNDNGGREQLELEMIAEFHLEKARKEELSQQKLEIMR
jgi:hypothetical protein